MQLLVPWEEASLPLLLSFVRSRMRQVMGRMLVPFGVTPQQFQALRALARRPGISHGELAGTLGLDKPSATRLLQGLHRKGWLNTQPCPSHARRLQLRLTPSGEDLIHHLETFRQDFQQGVERDIPEQDLHQLRSILKQLTGNLDRMEAESSGSNLRTQRKGHVDR